MEFVLLGVTLIVALVAASVINLIIVCKVMLNPGYMKKVYKKTFKMMEEISEDLIKDFEKKDEL